MKSYYLWSRSIVSKQFFITINENVTTEVILNIKDIDFLFVKINADVKTSSENL